MLKLEGSTFVMPQSVAVKHRWQIEFDVPLLAPLFWFYSYFTRTRTSTVQQRSELIQSTGTILVLVRELF